MAMSDHFFQEEHRFFRAVIRRWFEENIVPHVDTWEHQKSFPRELYQQVGQAGFLSIGFPEESGGAGGDLFHMIVLTEELIRTGSAGLAASLGSLGIAAPPIVRGGTEEQKRRWLPRIFSGEWIAALAVTEPDTGSDVANIRTRAVREGDHYVVTGSKTFITSGTRADFLTTVVRTGGDGFGGVSLLGIETNSPGFTVNRNLEKMGWHASDTAELSFDEVRVPVENLIGPENGGFGILMQNFVGERLILAIMAVEQAQLAFESCRSYCDERRAFGRTLAGFQVTRHKLAEMATSIDVARIYNYMVAQRYLAGEMVIREVCQAKNNSTDMACKVIDQAVQLHGGYGYMREYLVERLYRDVRILPIGGGTREIMNEVISKQLGL